jgi:hypothetical protein
MDTAYVPPVPSLEPVPLSREALGVLSLVDIAGNPWRLLMLLLKHMDEEDGCAEISQAEMCAALGMASPSVNRAVKRLAEVKLAWGIEDGVYQLHPQLTEGKMRARIAAVPEIDSVEPAEFAARRQAKYRTQLAGLGLQQGA